MITGVKLDGNKTLTNNKNIGIYNKPKNVFIPLINANDDNVTVLVKRGEYVYKGTPVGHTKGKLKTIIHASVSGEVIGFAPKMYLSGKEVNCVVIENDYKEKRIEKSKTEFENLGKKEFVDLLKETGIVGMGGSSFPTYVKYDTKQSIKTLIVNAVECEPYITADHILFEDKCEEILDAIDKIMEINSIGEAFIAIKKNNQKLISKINSFLGTYLKIKVIEVPNLYPMGWERNLVKFIKKVDYNVLPIECGIVVNNLSTIYAIYEALKYNRELTERIITISGDMVKKPMNILVKIGTPVKEIIESLDGYKRSNDIVFIAGGPMMGTSLTNDDLVVSANLNSVLVIKKEDNVNATNCLRCGKCVEKCPAKLSPVLIKDAINDEKKLKCLNPKFCIECGICSFICPAKINVRGYVKRAKENIKGE